MNKPFCLMVPTKSKRLSEVDVKSHNLADLPGKHHIPGMIARCHEEDACSRD